MTVAERGGCELVKVDESTDDNDNYFDESQWGINSQQPARVASLCRVQWNGARFADLVTAGTGCTGYPNDQWPPGFPTDWPPLPSGIEVSPGSLMMSIKGLGLNDAATTAVLNHTGSDVPVQVSPPARNYFSWPSGTFTAPAYGELPITVMFEGGDAPGEYRDSVRVLVGADLGVHRAGHRHGHLHLPRRSKRRPATGPPRPGGGTDQHLPATRERGLCSGSVPRPAGRAP